MHEKFLEKFITLYKKNYIKNRESTELEFKEKFSYVNIAKYVRTMSSFSNNRGGYILFGITNSPRKLAGVKRDDFEEIKQERITDFLIEYFSPQISWEIGVFCKKNQYIGFIYTNESDRKPIICKKNYKDILKSGEIYYRYRAQSRKISYSELIKIIENIKKNEIKNWLETIKKIEKIGPENIALIDVYKGTITNQKIKGEKLIIDEKLLVDLNRKINLIKDKKTNDLNKPIYRIDGSIKTANNILIPDIDMNRDYPYFESQISEKLKLKQYHIHLLIWKFKIKFKKKYHQSIKTSKNQFTHKYSVDALKRLEEIVNKYFSDEYIKKISKEYTNFKKKRLSHVDGKTV